MHYFVEPSKKFFCIEIAIYYYSSRLVLQPPQISSDQTNKVFWLRKTEKFFSCFSTILYSILYLASACFAPFVIFVGFSFVPVEATTSLILYPFLVRTVLLPNLSFSSRMLSWKEKLFNAFIVSSNVLLFLNDVNSINVLIKQLKCLLIEVSMWLGSSNSLSSSATWSSIWNFEVKRFMATNCQKSHLQPLLDFV